MMYTLNAKSSSTAV